MDYPMVRQQVDAGQLALHGWHYVIEDGEVHVFDVQSGAFVPASDATHSGTGPYRPANGDIDDPVFNEIDASYGQRIAAQRGGEIHPIAQGSAAKTVAHKPDSARN